MRARLSMLALACCFVPQLGSAQGTPTGTISGRVTSSDRLSMPGVTVTATSPMLQGERIAVTTENGDFLLAFLPPGEYDVSISLDGFKTLKQRTRVAAAEVARLNATLEPAPVTETVEVVGASTEVIKQTATAATTFSQSLVNELPLNRGIDATVVPARARARQRTPSGQRSIEKQSLQSWGWLLVLRITRTTRIGFMR